jgi:hypothetical protein
MDTVSFMEINDNEFDELDPPPAKGRPLCSVLASSYALGKYFFWNIHHYNDGSRGLWVTKADMLKDSLTTK